MNDPQSLHKYLYVHGDAVNGVDPTGRSFVVNVCVGLLVLGAAALLFPIPQFTFFFRWWGYPSGRTYSETKNRLDYINALIVVMSEVGGLYTARRENGISMHLVAQAVECDGHLVEDPAHRFPDNWSYLDDALFLAWTAMYRRVGCGGVYVVSETRIYLRGGAGLNVPWAPGITLSEEKFFSRFDEETAEFFVHEVLHNKYPFRHGRQFYADDEPIVVLEDDPQTTTFQRFYMWAYFTRDENGKSLWMHIQEEASERARRGPPYFGQHE